MIDDILLFVELVNNNCMLNNTAHKLGISQPTLSRRISNLEYHLGYELFDRINNNLIITENGKTLYKHYIGMANLIYSRQLQLNNQLNKYKIRIMSGHYSYKLVLDLINKVTLKNRNISFEINSHDHLATLDTYDIIISHHPPEENSMTETKLLASLDIGLYCSSVYLKKYGELTSPHDLLIHKNRLFLLANILQDGFLHVQNIRTNKSEAIYIGNSKISFRQVIFPPKEIFDHMITSAPYAIMNEKYRETMNYIKLFPEYKFGNINLFITYNKYNNIPSVKFITENILAHYYNKQNSFYFS